MARCSGQERLSVAHRIGFADRRLRRVDDGWRFVLVEFIIVSERELEFLAQSLPASKDIGLHLREGDAKFAGDFLTTEILKVEEHEWDALSRRKFLQCVFQQSSLIRFIGLMACGFLGGNFKDEIVPAIRGEHLREESPTRPIAGEVIEAKVARYRFEPTSNGGAFGEVIEALVGLEEHLLRDVLCVGLVPEKPDGGAEYHVLVRLHELCELVRFCHWLCRSLIRRILAQGHGLTQRSCRKD